MSPLRINFSCLLACLFLMGTLHARNQTTSTEILKKRFPYSQITPHKIELSPSQKKKIKKMATLHYVANNYIYYTIRKSQKIILIAIEDRHKVRTKRQTLLISIRKNGMIQNVDIIRFKEPRRFKAPHRWLTLLTNKNAKKPLMLGKDLAGISGATITAKKTSESARRTLQIAKIIFGKHKKIK